MPLRNLEGGMGSSLTEMTMEVVVLLLREVTVVSVFPQPESQLALWFPSAGDLPKLHSSAGL
jgi:hypothetical protein